MSRIIKFKFFSSLEIILWNCKSVYQIYIRLWFIIKGCFGGTLEVHIFGSKNQYTSCEGFDRLNAPCK